MSQATPSRSREHASFSGSLSRKSNGSPFKPPRYPSFSFRRAVSRTPDRMSKAEEAPVPEATRTRSAPTMSESDGTQTGKLFHVRVTMGYLKAIQRAEKQKAQRNHRMMDTSLVMAFASLDPQVSSDHNYAPSMPLSVTSSTTNVVWPKQNQDEGGINKSNRRLYFSATLQREDDDDALRNVLTSRDDDLSTVTGTTAWNHEENVSYSPQLVKIQLGVARGMDLLHLGVATLVVDGTNVSGKQMDLPVRTLLPGEDDSSASSSPKKRGRLRRLFGKKSKPAQNSFAADEYEYSFTPNALLRIRIDVISDATPLARMSMSGPAVWGDGVEDDNDSFTSIVVMDMSRDETPEEEERIELAKEASQRGETSVVQISTDASESIEVVNNPTGPSIISTPPKYVEPDVVDIDTHPSAIVPVTSISVSPQDSCSPTSRQIDSPARSILTTGMFCGIADAFTPRGIEADPSQHLDFEDSSTIATSQYKGTRGEAWKIATKKSPDTTHSLAASSGILRNSKSLGTVDERTEDNTSRASAWRGLSASRASASGTSALRPKNPRDSVSIGEDTLHSLDEAKKALQCYAERTGEPYHKMLEHLDIASSASDILSLQQSIGEDTVDSVLEAKELLQSYASRVGLDVEDLLQVDLFNWDSINTSDILSPTSTLGTRSGDETEGTNTTKSSKSRFDLFVDD